MTNKKPKSASTAVLGAFSHRGRHYEQRLVNCGKTNCSRCNPTSSLSRPSHGPYWYLCVQRAGRWRRIYLGKELDTEKYIDNSNNIDWKTIGHRRNKGTPGDGLSSDHPGQADLVDEAAVAGVLEEDNPS